MFSSKPKNNKNQIIPVDDIIIKIELRRKTVDTIKKLNTYPNNDYK